MAPLEYDMKLRLKKKSIEFNLIPVILVLGLLALVINGFAGDNWDRPNEELPPDYAVICTEYFLDDDAAYMELLTKKMQQVLEKVNAVIQQK